MCLGLPCELLELGPDDCARVRDVTRTRTVSLLALGEPVTPGDWLLVHAGYAVARLTREQALDALTARSTPTEGSS